MATNTYEWKKINRILTDCKFCSAQGKGRGLRGVTQFGKCKQQQRPTVRQQLVYPPPPSNCNQSVRRNQRQRERLIRGGILEGSCVGGGESESLIKRQLRGPQAEIFSQKIQQQQIA